MKYTNLTTPLQTHKTQRQRQTTRRQHQQQKQTKPLLYWRFLSVRPSIRLSRPSPLQRNQPRTAAFNEQYVGKRKTLQTCICLIFIFIIIIGPVRSIC